MLPWRRKKLTVAQNKQRHAALEDMDVDLSRKAKRAEEIRDESGRHFLAPAVTGLDLEQAKPAKADKKEDDVDNDAQHQQQQEQQAEAEAGEQEQEQQQQEQEPRQPSIDVSKTWGVSVYHLKYVFMEEKVLGAEVDADSDLLSRSSPINEIEYLQGRPGAIRQATANVICPVDGKLGATYVHCLEGEDHLGEATHMLSYSWRYTVKDIVHTLMDYCEIHGLDPKRTYIWMDCLCINQHRIVEQRKNNDDKTTTIPLLEEFKEKCFPAIIKGGDSMTLLAMMDPIEAPVYLTRTWCIYEMYVAAKHKCKVEIVMPPKEQLALQEDVLEEFGGIGGLYKALGSTNIQNTQTTIAADREIILKLIEQEDGGGVDKVNQQVIELLQDWMRRTLSATAALRENTDDLAYATFCTNIGTVFWDNKACEEALEQYQKCVKIQERLLGEQDPDTAITYNNIGLVLKDLKEYEAALDQFRKCLAIDQASLGSNHPGVADSYSNIGCVLLDKGDYDAALEEYQKGLAIQEASLGKDHFDTATTYKCIGAVLEAKGDYDGAMEQYQKCLNIQFSSLGNDHPSTKSCLEAIRSLKDKMNKPIG